MQDHHLRPVRPFFFFFVFVSVRARLHERKLLENLPENSKIRMVGKRYTSWGIKLGNL